MKKALIPVLVVLVSVFYFGCAKKKTLVEFDIPYTWTMAVPAQTMDATATFTTPAYSTNIGEHLSKNGTNGNLVGEIRCTSFNIAATPTTSSGPNLSYIRSIKFYVNAQGQPEIQNAFLYSSGNDSIKPTDKSTALKINDNNLKNRFMENAVYYKVKLDSRSNMPASTITITQNIHVKAISEK
jgi:hypothetical protein